MVRRKSAIEADRVVFRMSSPAPAGDTPEPARAARGRDKPAEVPEHGWLASSLELLSGLRVSETPMDTLPGELIDEFFKVAH
jgi:hypothetical protein